MNRKVNIGILFLFVLFSFPALLKPADWKAGLGGGWETESMQSWGDGNLAVDFGSGGLWNYSGRWAPLSRLNPRMMAAWGGNQLAVDFGVHGVWTYDGRLWTKITR